MARYAERKKGTLLFKGKTESQVLRSTREEKCNSSFTAEHHRIKTKNKVTEKRKERRDSGTVNKEEQGRKVM